jgi:hypothetical protein
MNALLGASGGGGDDGDGNGDDDDDGGDGDDGDGDGDGDGGDGDGNGAMAMMAMVFSQNVQAALGAESEEYSCLMNALNAFDSQQQGGEATMEVLFGCVERHPKLLRQFRLLEQLGATAGRDGNDDSTTDAIREKRPVMMKTSAVTPKCSAKAMM